MKSTASPPPPVESSPSLRVALIARSAPAELRDPLAYAVSLATALQAAGVQVHLFADTWMGPAQPSFPFHKVVTAPVGSDSPVATARVFCSAAVEVVGRVSHEAGAFHILHACSWATAPAALSGRRHGGARAAVTFLDTVFSRTGACNSDRAMAQVRNLEQQAARDADLVIAGHEAVRRELAWLYGADGDRVQVIPADVLPADPVGAKRASIPRSADEPRIGFAGVWSAEGGSDLFLQMARQMADEQPGLRIIIDADQITPAKVQADLRRRGLGGLLAQPADEQNPLADCDVVVVPARTAIGHRGVYRARAAGVPVVVTRTGPAELVHPGNDGAWAFPFAESLIAEVKKLLAQRMSLLPDDSFTWSKSAINLIANYRASIARSDGLAEKTTDAARVS